MLRKLINNERQLIIICIALVLPGTIGAALVFSGPLFLALRRGDPTGAIICLAFAAAVITFPWLVFVYRFVYLSSARHLPQCLARYGSAPEIMSQIDAELADPTRVVTIGQATYKLVSPQPDCVLITENWFLRLCPGGSVVIRLEDLVWVHKRIVARSALLSMGRMEHQLSCRMHNGDVWSLDTWTELKTDQVLRELLERQPEILTGWHSDWLDLAERGNEALWSEIERRREELKKLTPEEREAWLDRSWDDYQRFLVRDDRQAGRR